MSRESLSAVLRSSPCFLTQIFYGDPKEKPHGKLSVANEDLSHDARKWFRHMNSEGESCHCGKLHLPFAVGGFPRCSSGHSNSRSFSHLQKSDRSDSTPFSTMSSRNRGGEQNARALSG